MGPALAMQSTKNMSQGQAFRAALGGVRPYNTKTGKAGLHTAGPQQAQAVDVDMMRSEPGMREVPVSYRYSNADV